MISYIHNFIAKLLIAIIFSVAFLWHFAVAAVGQIAAPILRRVYCRLTKQICELTKRTHTHAHMCIQTYVRYVAVSVLMCDYSPVCCCCCFIVQPLGSKNWFLIIIIVIIMATIFGMLL